MKIASFAFKMPPLVLFPTYYAAKLLGLRDCIKKFSMQLADVKTDIAFKKVFGCPILKETILDSNSFDGDSYLTGRLMGDPVFLRNFKGDRYLYYNERIFKRSILKL